VDEFRLVSKSPDSKIDVPRSRFRRVAAPRQQPCQDWETRRIKLTAFGRSFCLRVSKLTRNVGIMLKRVSFAAP
jgi:hypothetical protein